MTRADHLAHQAKIAAAVRLPTGDDATVLSLAVAMLAQYAARLEGPLGETLVAPWGEVGRV